MREVRLGGKRKNDKLVKKPIQCKVLLGNALRQKTSLLYNSHVQFIQIAQESEVGKVVTFISYQINKCCKIQMIKILLKDCFETQKFAQEFVRFLKPKDIVLLKGDLGTGKSYFARSFIQSLLGKDTEVPSPTFTLVQEYETSLGPICHFDLYRLKNENEIFELGIEEAFTYAINLIEWPKRLGSFYPKEYICLDFSFTEKSDERLVTIYLTQRYKWIAEKINTLLPKSPDILK